jgi:predicted Zn-dependent peptidase
MQNLKVTQENLRNQKEVVLEEARLRVLNQPYGLFQWHDLWQNANTNWHNSNNLNLNDIENATPPMVVEFYQKFYVPNNAVLIVVGDVEVAEIKKKVEKYFAKIPSKKLSDKPDIQEAVQTQEKRLQQKDKFATLPALAIGYHMPPQTSPDYSALVLLNAILQGDPGSSMFHPMEDHGSRLYKRLVKEKQLCLEWSGAINLNPYNAGNEFDYSGPMLLTMYGIYKNGVHAEEIIANIDGVIHQIQTDGVTDKELESAKVRFRSDYYDQLESHTARANLLASFALFWDDPSRINTALEPYMRVSLSDIKAAAAKYLVPTNRTIIDRIPEK